MTITPAFRVADLSGAAAPAAPGAPATTAGSVGPGPVTAGPASPADTGTPGTGTPSTGVPGGAARAEGRPPALATARHTTPLGDFLLGATEHGLLSCDLVGATGSAADRTPAATGAVPSPESRAHAGGWLELAARELDGYFAGSLRAFTVPVDLRLAAPFDRAVLAELAAVPYGETTTYGLLARKLALPPGAARAVGRVMALNPVMIIVPCHRVVGSDGRLTGYAGGLAAKRRLLDLESADRELRLDLGI
ncbi:methylated-DNA--[protein]-cysteine S-methyltransferase [Allostreptomyces psammosilenae]|uniref:methylated-DNA--[protein]-cysteine S-methyltransferase n=1 Tax=Allostreptomyces psammosilenae TaxID=1892865 RepID=A0A853A0P7_9ACTN|nr:methylated-DNA--[protein]-cysteine S-methyltransferase [Allostreptomyces psammosilenae]NYI04082.1 O-6-methylguanine DNA methyltransferase [Allostreptomyces psammosilenae]